MTLTLLPATSAHADPAVAATGAQNQLQALADKAEILVEKYNAAQDQLTIAQRRLSAERAAIAVVQQTVDSSQLLVDAVASTAYKSGSLDGMQLDGMRSVLLAKDPQLAMQGADTIARLAAERGRDLGLATAARNKLVEAQASAIQQLAGVQSLQASLKTQQKTIDAMVGQQESALKTAQAAEAAQSSSVVATTVAASRAQVRVALPAAAAPKAVVASVPAGASGRASAVLKYAYAQIGKPYRYGAAGAATFDCSGLTMRAYGAAGISIGHNAAGQYSSTKHVARSALQPGDLVYFGRPIHHVGIYVGGGKFIEAPYTGARVRVSNLASRHDYAGASRP